MSKAYYLSLSVLALCLASCSSSKQDDPLTPENPDTPNPDLVSIGFGGNSGAWQDAPASRANNTRVGLESICKSFRVWGYKSIENETTENSASTSNTTSQVVMDGYYVNYTQNTAGSSTSNTADWEYVGVSNPNSSPQTIKYWDYSAKDYRFFAYAPATLKTTVETTTQTVGKTVSIPFDYSESATATSVPYASDLWYSNNNKQATPPSSGAYGKCVTLTFAPLIAKVRFKFSYPDGSTGVSITDIKFRDSRYIDDEAQAKTPLKGSIVATYPLSETPTAQNPSDGSTRYAPQVTWKTSTATGATGALIFTTPWEEEKDALHILDKAQWNKWYYVPPLGNAAEAADGTDGTSSLAQGPYTITATIDGNHTSATVPAAYMQWKVGYQYTYIFKITQAGTGITFTDLQVEEWLPGTNFENQGNGTAGW